MAQQLITHKMMRNDPNILHKDSSSMTAKKIFVDGDVWYHPDKCDFDDDGNYINHKATPEELKALRIALDDAQKRYKPTIAYY